jgi:hypothetical protein
MQILVLIQFLMLLEGYSTLEFTIFSAGKFPFLLGTSENKQKIADFF